MYRKLRNMKQKEIPYPKEVAEYDYPIEHHLTYPPDGDNETNFC